MSSGRKEEGGRTPAEEEQVIKKRLLTQTAVARLNADPPLKKVAKRFDAVCAAAELDGVAAGKLLAQFSRELTLFEFQLAKAATVCGANEREQESYAAAQAQLLQSITQAQTDIQSLKGELEGARLERRQKEEYEVLRKQCMVHPSRSHTLASITAVKSEIVALELESAATSARVEERKAQFSRLLANIDELAAAWSAS